MKKIKITEIIFPEKQLTVNQVLSNAKRISAEQKRCPFLGEMIKEFMKND